jgi:chromosome segregation ATPase
VKKIEANLEEVSKINSTVAAESKQLESALERESLLRGQVAEKITGLENDRQLVEVSLAEVRGRSEQLQHQLDASNVQLQTADKDKQALTAEVDSLKTNAEQLQHQLDASNAQLQAADKDKQTLTAQVNSLQVNVDQRFEELAKLSQHLKEIEDSRLSSKIRNAGKLLRPRKS